VQLHGCAIRSDRAWERSHAAPEAEGHLIRRAAFLAGSAAFAAAPRRAPAQSLTKIRIASSPDQDVVGALWGVQSGIFKRYGLDVDVRSAGSGAVVAAALVGGALEVGKSSVLGLITAHAKGVPFVLEAPAALWDSDVPISALVVAKNSPIRTGRDLNGKTLSVPALGDLFTIANSAWIDQHGGDSRTVRFLELPHRAAAEAIAAGRVDAATLAQQILHEAIDSGKCRILGYSLGAIAKRFLITAYVCTADYATQSAAVLARFRKGLYEAAAYADAHPAEMAAVIARYSGLDPQTVGAFSAATLADSASQLDPRLIQPVIDAAVAYKAIPRAFPAAEMIDPNALIVSARGRRHAHGS
jgi:NitT/TauT family transport system substrate-binding protein